MSIQPSHEYRRVPRRSVNPVAPRQFTAPQLVIPRSAKYPLTRVGRSLLPDSPGELLRGGRVAQLHARQRESPIDEVGMGIQEAGNYPTPGQVEGGEETG